MKASTTISISENALRTGQEIAKKLSRSFSGQVEQLIIEEAERRGIAPVTKPKRRRKPVNA